MNPPPDRLRDLLDVIVDSLDDDVDGTDLAANAYLSRFHFDRLVQAATGEPPGRLRRRLLLERAAWQLGDGSTSVSAAALAAGYRAPEAFSRAFAKAFGFPPSTWATTGRGFRLPAPNGVHFHPPGGLLLSTTSTKGTTMDLLDRMLEHDLAVTRALLESAATLDDEPLDHPARPGNVVLSFDGPEASARAILARLVFTKEIWNAAIVGRAFPDGDDKSIDALRQRLDVAGPEFVEIARGVRDRNEWDTSFVDALCDPPESFSFGGVIAHVLTYSAHRREVLHEVLAELGAEDLPSTDPNQWDRITE